MKDANGVFVEDLHPKFQWCLVIEGEVAAVAPRKKTARTVMGAVRAAQKLKGGEELRMAVMTYAEYLRAFKDA